MSEDKCPVCGNPITPQDTACPACGFKLLGSTQKFQPINYMTGEPLNKPVSKLPLTATMTVVRGPQVGTCYKLDDKQLTVGRSPQCDIFLNDMTVSREHAMIMPKDGQFFIKDTGSYNGVWINNESVEEAPLKDNDVVQIGAFLLTYNE